MIRRLGLILALLFLVGQAKAAGPLVVAFNPNTFSAAAGTTGACTFTSHNTGDLHVVAVFMHQSQGVTNVATVTTGGTTLGLLTKSTQSGNGSQTDLFTWTAPDTANHAFTWTTAAGSNSQVTIGVVELGPSAGIGAIRTKSGASPSTLNLTMTAVVVNSVIAVINGEQTSFAADAQLTPVYAFASVQGGFWVTAPFAGGFWSVTQTNSQGSIVALEVLASVTTPTNTPTITATPSATPTITPSITPSATPSATPTLTPVPCVAGYPGLTPYVPVPKPAYPASFDVFNPSGTITGPFPSPCRDPIAAASQDALPLVNMAVTGANQGYAQIYAQTTNGNGALYVPKLITHSAQNWVYAPPANFPAHTGALLWTQSSAASGINGLPVPLNMAKDYWCRTQGSAGGLSLVAGDLTPTTLIGADMWLGDITPAVAVTDGSSNSVLATVIGYDEGSVDFLIPAGLPAGPYGVSGHNGHGQDYGWGAPMPVTIGSALTWPGAVINLTTVGGVGDGSTDNVTILTWALTQTAATRGTLYIPTSFFHYMTSNLPRLTGSNHVIGDGPTLSVIEGVANYAGNPWGDTVGTSHFDQDFENFSLYFPTVNSATIASNSDYLVNFTGSHNVTLRNMSITSACYNASDGKTMTAAGRNTGGLVGTGPGLIDHVNFFCKIGTAGWPSGTVVQDCVFTISCDGSPGGFNDVTGAIWRRNKVQNANTSDPQGQSDGRGGDNTVNAPGPGNSGIYWGQNDTRGISVSATKPDKNSGDGHWVLYECGAITGIQQVTATSGTLTTVTVPNDGSSAYKGWVVAVIDGPGYGEVGVVVSDSAGGLTMAAPWGVSPTSTSVLLISPLNYNCVVVRNQSSNPGARIDDSASGGQVSGGAWHFWYIKNQMDQGHNGVFLSAAVRAPNQEYGIFWPVVAGNTISNSISSTVALGDGIHLQVAVAGSVPTETGRYLINASIYGNSITGSAGSAARIDVTDSSSMSVSASVLLDGGLWSGNAGAGHGFSSTAGARWEDCVGCNLDSGANPNLDLNFWEAGYVPPGLLGHRHRSANLAYPWSGTHTWDLSTGPLP